VLARILELEILRGQIGVEEGPANNTGERVHEYQDSGSYPFTSAWCVDFGGVWGHRLATGARRVKIKGEWQLKGGEEIAGGTASCSIYEADARKRGRIVKGKPAKGDKMILDPGVHFTTIDVVQKVLPGLLYVVTIEGNTTSFDALSKTPHNRDGVYRKRRIVRRSSVTIIRVPGVAKPIDPLAVAALHRLEPKPKPKPKPKPAPTPKPASTKVAPAILRARKGYFAWLAWTLGEGDWKGYGERNAAVRPAVRKKAGSWWARRTAFLARRKK
jgi:hypothetical protein